MNLKNLLFLLLLPASSPLLAQQKGNMTSKSEMQEQVTELKKEIADLEKELADARKNSPGDVAEIESEIRNMKMALGMATRRSSPPRSRRPSRPCRKARRCRRARAISPRA